MKSIKVEDNFVSVGDYILIPDEYDRVEISRKGGIVRIVRIEKYGEERYDLIFKNALNNRAVWHTKKGWFIDENFKFKPIVAKTREELEKKAEKEIAEMMLERL